MGQKPTEEEIFKMINEIDSQNKGVIGIFISWIENNHSLTIK